MANKQLADDLRAARAVIENPEAWTKRAYAKKANRRRAETVLSGDAVSFCAIGAICRVTGEREFETVRSRHASDFIRDFIPPNPHASALSGVAAFNDRRTTTHADILSLFDRAIAAAEAS